MLPTKNMILKVVIIEKRQTRRENKTRILFRNKSLMRKAIRLLMIITPIEINCGIVIHEKETNCSSPSGLPYKRGNSGGSLFLRSSVKPITARERMMPAKLYFQKGNF